MNKHNWITALDDALIDMAMIEGDHWLEQEMRWIESRACHRPTSPQNFTLHDAPEFSVAAAIHYIEHVKEDEEYDEYDQQNNRPYNFSTSVYGRGGWHRWFFTDKGGIIFSAHHSRLGIPRIADDLNFEVS